MSKKYDILGIDNTPVDLFYFVDDRFIEEFGFKKSETCIINTETFYKISQLECKKIIAGGSVANSVRILSLLGKKSSFIGKIANDKYGNLFLDDIRKHEIDFYVNTESVNKNTNYTITVLILVTKDAQCTMCVHQEESPLIDIEDIDYEMVKNSKFLYFCGYVWKQQKSVTSLYQAAKISREAGNKVIMSPSASYCIELFMEDFWELINNYLDVFICNEEEFLTLVQEKNFDLAIKKIKKFLIQKPNLIFVITREEKDVIIFHNSKTIKVSPANISKKKLVDVTGAGDAFSAGFIYGLINGYDLEKCGELGNFIASMAIQKVGGRLSLEEVDKIRHC
ncbi:adenosine kinase [Pseudomonadota bacterium]